MNAQALLKKYGLWAKKSLGQNFLINDASLQAILDSANIQKEDHILEIGPGLGVLTAKLCEKAKLVNAIDLDPDMIDILTKELSTRFKNLRLICGDALKADPLTEFFKNNTDFKVVANIPYYITSPLLNHFLQSTTPPKNMTLLVQKEVAEKICSPSEKDRGILWLQVALFAKAELIKIVPAQHFHPMPKVDSAIIHLDVAINKQHNKNTTNLKKNQSILKIAKIAFSGRRKKLINTLGTFFPKPKLAKIQNVIDLARRPQTLSLQEWETIANFQETS